MSHALQDASNYLPELESTSAEVFAKYGLLIAEYLRLAAEARRSPEGGAHYAYVLASGVRTLTHVFRVLLLYTRNMTLTWYHCQKAAYYYVEFMGQIGADTHGFLQLNTKDAALFVYKKTIFDINNECRREFGSLVGQDDRWDNIDTLTGIYGRCVEDVINDTGNEPGGVSGAETVSKQLTGLSRCLFNLALVGTEGGYRARLELVAWLEKSTAGWGSSRIRLLEVFARKLRSHRLSLARLKTKWAEDGGMRARESATLYVNWLLGRRASRTQ